MNNNETAPCQYLTLAETAELLRCSKRTIHNMVVRGDLSAFKVAERILFRVSEVEAFLSKARVRTFHM